MSRCDLTPLSSALEGVRDYDSYSAIVREHRADDTARGGYRYEVQGHEHAVTRLGYASYSEHCLAPVEPPDVRPGYGEATSPIGGVMLLVGAIMVAIVAWYGDQ